MAAVSQVPRDISGFAGTVTDGDRAADPRWRTLYRIGGVAAFIMVAITLSQFVAFAVAPPPLEGTAAAWFEFFRGNALLGLWAFELSLVAYAVLSVPLALALYAALRRTSEAVMAVATALSFRGVADYLATSNAFPVLTLSNQYAAATTEAERATLLAAGQAMFTLFNENAFLVSHPIVSAAGTMIAGVLLRSSLSSRPTAYAGILVGAAGIVAVVLEHAAFVNALFALAVAQYFAAIDFLFLWVVLAGRRLYELGTSIGRLPPVHPRTPPC
jgi:hypothetical protein